MTAVFLSSAFCLAVGYLLGNWQNERHWQERLEWAESMRKKYGDGWVEILMRPAEKGSGT